MLKRNNLQLKKTTINMKSFDQDIPDPIIAGGGDANGRTLSVYFTQEAAAQFTEVSRVYFSWYHQKQKISGLNVFDCIDGDRRIYSIRYPRSMCFKGDVEACIKLVDDYGITQSQNFIIHVCSDPNDIDNFESYSDYSAIEDMLLDYNKTKQELKELIDKIKDDGCLEEDDDIVEFYNTDNTQPSEDDDIVDFSKAESKENSVIELDDVIPPIEDDVVDLGEIKQDYISGIKLL